MRPLGDLHSCAPLTEKCTVTNYLHKAKKGLSQSEPCSCSRPKHWYTNWLEDRSVVKRLEHQAKILVCDGAITYLQAPNLKHTILMKKQRYSFAFSPRGTMFIEKRYICWSWTGMEKGHGMETIPSYGSRPIMNKYFSDVQKMISESRIFGILKVIGFASFAKLSTILYLF